MPRCPYRIYVTYLPYPSSYAAVNALVAATTKYVCSAESRVCISARLNDFLQCTDGHISIFTAQRSYCAILVSHSAKTFGKFFTLPFNVTKTEFVVIACFSSIYHRYERLFHHRYWSCRLHDILHRTQHPGFTMVRLQLLSLIFHILYDTLLILFVYVCSDDRKVLLSWEEQFYQLPEKMALEIWHNTIRCWQCRILSGSTKVVFDWKYSLRIVD